MKKLTGDIYKVTQGNDESLRDYVSRILGLGTRQDSTRKIIKPRDGKTNLSGVLTLNILDILTKIASPSEKKLVTY